MYFSEKIKLGISCVCVVCVEVLWPSQPIWECGQFYLTTLSWGRLSSLCFLIELGFNDTPTIVGNFVSSPREREKRDRRDSREDEREEQERKENE